MPREHGDDGTYVETVPLGKVLEVFDAVDGPVILSADVADELDCSLETARRKLQQLHDRGDLARRKVSRRVIYWRAANADTFDAEELRGDPETTLGYESGESEDTPGVADLAVLSFDRDLTDPLRSHLEAWIRHAAGADGVSKSDFEDWWTEDRANETGYNAWSFWEAFAKAAMKQSDHFTKPNNRTYRYTRDV